MSRARAKEIDSAEKYPEFLRSLELVTIALTKCSLSIDRPAFAQAEGIVLSAELDCEAEIVDVDAFEITASLTVDLTEKESNSVVGSIQATYQLHFHTKGAKKATINAFAKSDVRLMVWPYFRELITSLSSRMLIPPIILPISGHSRRVTATKKRE